MNPQHKKVGAAATAAAAVGVLLLLLLPHASAFTVIDSSTSDAGGTCSTGKVMTTLSDTSARGQLTLPGDQYDNFRWSLYRTEKINLQVTEDTSTQFFQASSFDTFCNVGPGFSQTTVTGGRHQFTASIKAAATGFHNLQVYALPGSANGFYWVTYNVQQDDANSGGDAPDSSGSAYPIPSFGTVHGLVTPRSGFDDDYYRISVPALATFKVTLDQDTSTTSIDLELTGKTTVASNTAPVVGTKSLYCVNPTASPVNIVVRVFQSGGSTSGTGPYALSATTGTSTVVGETTVC
jgi:hypothetical protein